LHSLRQMYEPKHARRGPAIKASAFDPTPNPTSTKRFSAGKVSRTAVLPFNRQLWKRLSKNANRNSRSSVFARCSNLYTSKHSA
jgi:hypothetical protein